MNESDGLFIFFLALISGVWYIVQLDIYPYSRIVVWRSDGIQKNCR